MIFPTIMFWVWMQAQGAVSRDMEVRCTGVSPHQQCLQAPQPVEPGQCPMCKPMECDGRGNCKAMSLTATSPEHVIEIRTKHDTTAAFKDETCPAGWLYQPRHHVGGDLWEFSTCTRVTREIWIDGVKWGVLRESSQ